MSKTAVVTGVSGYLGLHIAKELLDAGYSVVGTIRSRDKEAVVLEALEPVVETAKLSFVIADLNDDSGWSEAMVGADYLMHVASPFILKEPKDLNEYMRPAKEGTRRVLKAAAAAGVKRVVATSTYLTMAGHLTEGTYGPESRTSIDDPKINAYIASKIGAENEIWDFQGENPGGPEIVTIHPGAIMGPPLNQSTDGTSMSTLKSMIEGKIPGIPPIYTSMVDVRDVAKLHVTALETANISGNRYVAAHAAPNSYFELSEILRAAGYEKTPTRMLPALLIRTGALFSPEMRSMRAFLGKKTTADNSASIRDLGFAPRDLKETILETAASLSAQTN